MTARQHVLQAPNINYPCCAAEKRG